MTYISHEFAAMQGRVVEQEIRGVIYHFPEGPTQGYEWRLLMNHPAMQGKPPTVAWTPWMFGSIPETMAMLEQWQTFLQTEGHMQTSAPPGSSVQ